ncbi:MAG: site-2 protease family protein [Desulfovibrionaceae bacterium]|nr:site-2 protease family protein [Desulfovibrionaceae bacterium]
MLEFDVHRILICLVPAMAGIILHEVAHGYVAYLNGDPTAKMAGRLTLNPISHIDPMGLLVFVLTSISGAFVFCWAKPVPVQPIYFRRPSYGLMWTALAGPMTNFFLAIFFAFLLWVLTRGFFLPFWQAHEQLIPILQSCQVGVYINLGLAWLNLLPIPPLDGSKVLNYFLPPHISRQYLALERWGMLILLVLLMTHLLSKILTPLVIGCGDILLGFLK